MPLSRLDTLMTMGRVDPRQQSRDSMRPLGIARMMTATASAAQEAGVEFHAGVLVQELTGGNRLSRRIPVGSIITAVMDQPVRDVEEFITALADRDLPVHLHAGRDEHARVNGRELHGSGSPALRAGFDFGRRSTR